MHVYRSIHIHVKTGLFVHLYMYVNIYATYQRLRIPEHRILQNLILALYVNLHGKPSSVKHEEE